MQTGAWQNTGRCSDKAVALRPKADYSLTEMGRTFLSILSEINAWAGRYTEA